MRAADNTSATHGDANPIQNHASLLSVLNMPVSVVLSLMRGLPKDLRAYRYACFVG